MTTDTPITAADPVRAVAAFEVVEVRGGEPLEVVAARMVEHRCGALLVRHHDGTVAIVSERDVLTSLARGSGGDWAVDLATDDPIIVPGDLPIVDAAEEMVEAGIRHLLVDRGDGHLGIVSMRDLIEPLLESIEVGAVPAALPPESRTALQELAGGLEGPDAPQRERTARLADDLRVALDDDEPEGLIERLEEHAVDFENDHPDLAYLIRRTADVISASGM